MAWKNDENGEKVYVASLYTKEELPTWAEFYEEFYSNKLFNSAHDDLNMDPYWKIPRSLVLLSQCCNQLNKMLFEDGLRDKIKEDFGLDDVRFLIDSFYRSSEDFYPMCGVGTDEVPPIYTIPLPTGKPNPFTTKHQRIDVTEMKDDVFIGYFVTKDGCTEPFYEGEDMFTEIIENILADVKEYFGGERPGWKDREGNNIQNNGESPVCNTGFDPAI